MRKDRSRGFLSTLGTALLFLAACDGPPAPPAPPEVKPPPAHRPNGEPSVITVKHVLVSFEGNKTSATRSKSEALQMAYDVLGFARKGQDFDHLMKTYSDDNAPGAGTYTLVNLGVEKQPGQYGRKDMVGAFGDVGFRLAVGEIGFADFDAATSPFGYHIIKRIK